jgi:hypothetical protein
MEKNDPSEGTEPLAGNDVDEHNLRKQSAQFNTNASPRKWEKRYKHPPLSITMVNSA